MLSLALSPQHSSRCLAVPQQAPVLLLRHSPCCSSSHSGIANRILSPQSWQTETTANVRRRHEQLMHSGTILTGGVRR